MIVDEQFIADGENKNFKLMNRAVEINHPLIRLVYGFVYYEGEELKPEDGVKMTEQSVEFKTPPPRSLIPIVVQYAVRKGTLRVPIVMR